MKCEFALFGIWGAISSANPGRYQFTSLFSCPYWHSLCSFLSVSPGLSLGWAQTKVNASLPQALLFLPSSLSLCACWACWHLYFRCYFPFEMSNPLRIKVLGAKRRTQCVDDQCEFFYIDRNSLQLLRHTRWDRWKLWHIVLYPIHWSVNFQLLPSKFTVLLQSDLCIVSLQWLQVLVNNTLRGCGIEHDCHRSQKWRDAQLGYLDHLLSFSGEVCSVIHEADYKICISCSSQNHC